MENNNPIESREVNISSESIRALHLHKVSGRFIKWTPYLCFMDAKRYATRKEWIANSTSYGTAQRQGWLSLTAFTELFPHSPPTVKWTLEACIANAKLYASREEWRNAKGSSYATARNNNWLTLPVFEALLPRNSAPRNLRWTKEICMDLALKYNTSTQWQKEEKRSYEAAARNGWLDDCRAHMEKRKKQKKISSKESKLVAMGTPSKWTREACLANAQLYTTRKEWREATESSYQAAIRNKWLTECTSHMQAIVYKRHIKWTKEKCIDNAKKFQNRKDWRESKHSSYPTARFYGWLDECTAHFSS